MQDGSEAIARLARRARGAGVDAFCEQGAFDADQCRAVLSAGAARGLAVHVHPNQLRPGPGAQLAASLGAASANHCTHLTDQDVLALRDADVTAVLVPVAEFSTGSAYAPARRLLDAGVPVALARLQPRDVLHHLDAVCHHAGLPRAPADPGRGGTGGDPGWRAGPAAARHRPPATGRAGRPRRAGRALRVLAALPARVDLVPHVLRDGEFVGP